MFFYQIYAVTMGDCLGLTLAHIFMGNLDQRELKHVIVGTTLNCKYIDDTFLVCRNPKHSMNIHNLLNKTHEVKDSNMKHEV